MGEIRDQKKFFTRQGYEVFDQWNMIAKWLPKRMRVNKWKTKFSIIFK